MTKQELVKLFFENNYLLAPELLKIIPEMDNYISLIETAKKNITKPAHSILITEEILKRLLEIKDDETDYPVSIVFSYNKESEKREIQDFVKYFRARYEGLKNILCTRQELTNSVSISRALEKNESERVSVIGLVSDKGETKKGNVVITVEDITGTIKVIATKKNEELMKKVSEVVYDEAIGVIGTTADKAIFANDIIFPDIPLTKELKKSPDETYAAFISDLHVGSDMFLPNELMRFISWINCETGTEEQKKIARKIKYLFIAGDLVDGIGIYPEQDKELLIKDIVEQYNKCAEYLAMIRKDIKLIICGGNHDALRLAEPQPCLDRVYAKAVYDLPNAIILSNPSIVNIHSSKGFPGFDVLMYHGYSFFYYVDNVNSIRNNGGHDRPDLVMKFLLQKRHLAPSHSSNLYIPEKEEDPMIIKKVPDFFITGHMHKADVSTYKGVSNISGSCWQSMTLLQEKLGNIPHPAKVPIVNLKTREITIMGFDK